MHSNPIVQSASYPRSAQEKGTAMSVLAAKSKGIDHVAIAVRDLEDAIAQYEAMGFTVESRLETKGEKSAMISAVMKAGPLTFVLLEGTTANSQVTRYIDHYGPGVQHVAIGVEDIEEVCTSLIEAGLEFETDLIEASDLRQRFSKRCLNSGIMLEIIERIDNPNFSEESVEKLFRQLENSDSF